MDGKHRVVVAGGGFGGLYAAQSFKTAPAGVTLIDRRNFHLFQPLLYQVATGALSPANVAAPLRAVLKRQKNVQVLLGEVLDFDPQNRKIILKDDEVFYDTLIVATGACHHYFGHHRWAKHAPGLKTVEEATEMRSRMLFAFEAAERETDSEQIRRWLRFVIVGAGPTGVELAGALAEIARDTLKHDFRNINPADARILLLESADCVLPTFPHDLSEKAKASLKRLGVTVRTETIVTDITPESVTVRSGDRIEQISTRTVLWAAGVQASPLGRTLAERTGTESDRIGRVVVGPDLSLPKHPEIFVIGDLAHFSHQTGQPLPGVAPVAKQQGHYVARLVIMRLKGKSLPPFRYRDYGNMATIGRAAAVADLGWLRFSGFVAWVVWLVVHLVNIIEFENRLLALVQWAWNYFTRNRAARLITGDAALRITAPDRVPLKKNSKTGS